MSNTDTVKKVYAMFQKGDVPGILDQCDDKVDWNNQGVTSKDVPWNGNFSTKKSLPGFFKVLAESLDFTKFEPMAFIEQGKSVAVHLRIESKAKKNGKVLANDCVHWWTFNDKGKIAKYRHFNDTGAERDVWK